MPTVPASRRKLQRFSLRKLGHRGLVYHWRSHLAALLAVAVASATITGALMVGDSVRGSLRERALERLGDIDHVLSSSGFFGDALATGIAGDGVNAVALIRLHATVVEPDAARRSARVDVYGVPTAFWDFWPDTTDTRVAFEAAYDDRAVFLNEGLAQAVGAEAGADVLLYFRKGHEIASEHLLGERADGVRPLRLTVAGRVPAAGPGLLRLDQGQRDPHIAFVPLPVLQRALEQSGRANTILIDAGLLPGEELPPRLQRSLELADLGLTLRTDDTRDLASLESRELLLTEPVLEAGKDAATETGGAWLQSLTYLANTIAVGEREIPYSTVTAIGAWSSGEAVAPLGVLAEGALSDRGVVLNEWAARELAATIGDEVRMRYFVVREDNSLGEEEASFELRAIVPLTGPAADPGWTPDFPGISNADRVSEWDPPFAVDLTRIQDRDEKYWDDHRATPKAFVPLSRGVELWSTRFGAATSLRLRQPPQVADLNAFAAAFRRRLLENITPASVGLVLADVRAAALEAARGATDFAQLFLAFSFFLILSALVLLALLYRLSCELRARELGTLGAVGYGPRAVRGLLLQEGRGIVLLGAIAGAVAGLAYGALLIVGLRSVWAGAVDAPFLSLHVRPLTLILGAGITAALAISTVRVVAGRLARTAPRELLVGGGGREPARLGRRRSRLASSTAALSGFAAAALIVFGLVAPARSPALVFFAAGACGLTFGLAVFAIVLRRAGRRPVRGRGAVAVAILGVRSAGRRPGRSLLAAGVLACASFIVVVVGAMHRDASVETPRLDSGDGGFALVGSTAVPVPQSLSTEPGREALGLAAATVKLLQGAEVHGFRRRPGDDASCRNLYRPSSPTVLGAPEDFIRRGGFLWSGSLAESDAERANPWLLLDRTFDDGAIPTVGDEGTVLWILHSKLGGDIEIVDDNGKPLVLRLVALVAHSIFQGELVISNAQFERRFPRRTGRGWFVVESPPERTAALENALEKDLESYGLDLEASGELLASYLRVQNTYLSTFQLLGGLGLLLGTFGLAVVLFRNVNERRGELALLRAVGFSRGRIRLVVFSETAALLVAGIATGGGAALVASTPALSGPASDVSALGLVGTLAAILLVGLVSAAVTLRAALRAPLLGALRSE